MNTFEIALCVFVVAFLVGTYRAVKREEDEADRLHRDMQHHRDRAA